PASPSAQAIAEIARRTSRWQAPTVPGGNVEFFVERIIQRGVAA
ncbi:MinD/ParA family protein, partial [Xanthomonas vasicola]